MKITGSDILMVRLAPYPHDANRKRLPLPDEGQSVMVRLTATASDGRVLAGLGEIRALTGLTGESPKAALNSAKALAEALIGAELDESLDGRAATAATAALVTGVERDRRGIAQDRALPHGLSPAVRYGLDLALLDLLARAQDRSLLDLLGGTAEPVTRNIFPIALRNPGEVVNRLPREGRPQGWLRGRLNRRGTALTAILSAVAAGTMSGGDALRGVWVDLGGRWTDEDFETFLASVSDNAMLKMRGLETVLEQPFPDHASAWYRAAFEAVSGQDGPKVHIMLKDAAVAPETLEPVADYLPHVDLKITPQRCGSVEGVFRLLEAARGHGFRGGVYLANAGRSTAFNSIVLATLARLVPESAFFSAIPVVSGSIRQVMPQLAAVEGAEAPTFTLPDGAGWGAELCRSVLTRRLLRACFLREGAEEVDHDALLEALREAAHDDSDAPGEEDLSVEEVDGSAQDDERDDEGDDDEDAPPVRPATS